MSVLPSFTNVWAALGIVGVTAVTLTGAAYGLFRYLGDKWLTAKFNERLESYKHAQQRELEQLRFKSARSWTERSNFTSTSLMCFPIFGQS